MISAARFMVFPLYQIVPFQRTSRSADSSSLAYNVLLLAVSDDAVIRELLADVQVMPRFRSALHLRAAQAGEGRAKELIGLARNTGFRAMLSGAKRDRSADLSMSFKRARSSIMPIRGWTAMRRFDRVYSRSGPPANECCGPSINSESAHTRASRRSGLFAPT